MTRDNQEIAMTFAKGLKRTMATLAAVASCWVGASWAVPVTWTNTVGKLDRLITPNDPYYYTHIISDVGSGGYRPGIDTISNASLYIWLYDDAFFGDIPFIGDGQETVGFRLDGGVWVSETVDSIFYSLDRFDFTVTSLLTDGVLNVGVKSYRGDFGFSGGRLVVTGDQADETSSTATPVPEPASLALFGFGLLGMGLASRLCRRATSIG